MQVQNVKCGEVLESLISLFNYYKQFIVDVYTYLKEAYKCKEFGLKSFKNSIIHNLIINIMDI